MFIIESFSSIVSWIIAFVVGLFFGLVLGKRQAPTNKKSKQALSPATVYSSDEARASDQSENSYGESVEVTGSTIHGTFTINRPSPEEEVNPDSVRNIEYEDIHTSCQSAKPSAASLLVQQSVGFGIGFLSSPNSAGEFDDMERHDSFRPDRSIYRIEYANEHKTLATYTIVEGPDAAELALRRREIVLDPVADMTNSCKRDSVAIVNEYPGQIELLHGVWKIRRKMQGRFE
jgi:hypothetical protein